MTVDGAERVPLVLRYPDGTEWLTVLAWPTETKGLYVHEHTSPEVEPGWQITPGFGFRLPAWFDSRYAATRCAAALGGECEDWSDLTPATIPESLRKSALPVLRSYGSVL